MNEKTTVQLTDNGRIVYGFGPEKLSMETTMQRAKILFKTGLAIDPNKKPKKEKAVRQNAETAMRKK